MARNVYFDPFGSRLAGYRMGVQDEMGLQRETRNARQSDWNFNYINPLQLQGLEREERYNQHVDSYRRRAADINERTALGNLFDAQNRRYLDWGNYLGDYSPAISNYLLYNSGQYARAPQYAGGMQTYIRNALDNTPADMNDPSAIDAKFGLPAGAFGQFLSRYVPYTKLGPSTERGIDKVVNWDRITREAEAERVAAFQQSQMQNAANNAAVNARNSDTAAQNAATAQQAATARYGVQNPYSADPSYMQNLESSGTYPSTEYGYDDGN